MSELDKDVLTALKLHALGKIRNDSSLEYVWEEDRELCVYGYDGFLFLIVTSDELERLETRHKPYWYDIQEPPVEMDSITFLIFGVDDYDNALEH